MSDRPDCDVCGAPATRMAQDLWRIENWHTGLFEYAARGDPRWRCEDHYEAPTVTDRGMSTEDMKAMLNEEGE